MFYRPETTLLGFAICCFSKQKIDLLAFGLSFVHSSTEDRSLLKPLPSVRTGHKNEIWGRIHGIIRPQIEIGKHEQSRLDRGSIDILHLQ